MSECFGCGQVHEGPCDNTASDVLIPLLCLGLPALFFVALIASRAVEWVQSW